MDAFFKGLGKKAGETYKKSRWLYDSLLGTEAEAIASEYKLGHQMAQEIIASSEGVEIEFIDGLTKRLAAWINTTHRFTCTCCALFCPGDDERLERRHRRGQVLAVINFQMLADNLRLFVKTAKAEVCREW